MREEYKIQITLVNANQDFPKKWTTMFKYSLIKSIHKDSSPWTPSGRTLLCIGGRDGERIELWIIVHQITNVIVDLMKNNQYLP